LWPLAPLHALPAEDLWLLRYMMVARAVWRGYSIW
jgi:hypothetical protein